MWVPHWRWPNSGYINQPPNNHVTPLLKQNNGMWEAMAPGHLTEAKYHVQGYRMGYTPTEETEEPKSCGGGRARTSLTPVVDWRMWSHVVGPGTSLLCWITQLGIRNTHSSCLLCAGRAKSIESAARVSAWEKSCLTDECLK